MKWRADLLAWANDAGVKVHDMRTDKGIAFIERPKGIPRPEFLLPHLVWQVIISNFISTKILLLEGCRSNRIM